MEFRVEFNDRLYIVHQVHHILPSYFRRDCVHLFIVTSRSNAFADLALLFLIVVLKLHSVQKH